MPVAEHWLGSNPSQTILLHVDGKQFIFYESPAAEGRTFWPSRMSPASPSRDSYDIPHKNQTSLSFACGIPIFTLTTVMTGLWTEACENLQGLID